MFKAIFFDFGGVITSSPFEAFHEFEKAHNLPQDFIRKINSNNPDSNAWARFERNEIDEDEFDRRFEQEAEAAGHKLAGKEILQLLTGAIRPEMVETLKTCKRHYSIACLTNNVKPGAQPATNMSQEYMAQVKEVMNLFDYVQESSIVGHRKPDPAFYNMACEAMNVEASQVVFLDDLGINLKPAKAMGMTTIKVTTAQQAISELAKLLNISLPK